VGVSGLERASRRHRDQLPPGVRGGSLTTSQPGGDHTQVLGHRGSPDPRHPENSVAAVTQGLRQGADGVEVDVRLTADDVLVCVHDEFLLTGSGERLDVAASASSELLGVAGQASLATLPEVLAAAQTPLGSRLVVEAKPVADISVAVRTAAVLADVLGAAAGSADVTVSSFDPDLLAFVRTTCAALPLRTALLGAASADAVAVVLRARADGHDEVHLPLVAVRTTPQAVAIAHWLGLAVTAWTVNRGRDLRWVAELGVDAVITDDVPGARSKLEWAAVGELDAPVGAA
jgi:glycerophosphoryl diester phosphodiesterase